MAVDKLVAHAGTGLNPNLERHPLVGYVPETVANRCKVRGGVLRVKTVRRRPAVLHLEVVVTERLFERVVWAVRRRTLARVVHLREASAIGVLHHGFERRAGRIQLAGLVAGADDDLLPTATTREVGREELRAETLSPLDVELRVFPKLHCQVA